MTIEITIRLEDPCADLGAFWEGIVCSFDPDAEFRGNLIGGLYFRTECAPAEFFVWLANENFEMTHFGNIEIKPV